MGFLRRIVSFVARPTHSRTNGLVAMLLLIATVSLTVYVAQQQQQIKQRAAAGDFVSPTIIDIRTEQCPDISGSATIIPGTWNSYCCPASHFWFCAKNNQCGITKSVCDTLQTPTLTPTPIPPTPTPACGTLGQICCSTGSECKINSNLFCGSNNTCQSSAGGATPTLTPTPSCSNYTSCDSCIFGAPYTCGWTGNSCETGTYPGSCPAGYSEWYWSSCSVNKCAVPTSTPTPVSACGSLNQACCGGNSCPNGANLTCSFDNICVFISTPTPTIPIGLCGSQFCAPNQDCVTDPSDGDKSCVDKPTPTSTPIGLCGTQICTPTQFCFTDPGDGEKSCREISGSTPTPIITQIPSCSIATLTKGNLPCFAQLYREWISEIRAGRSNILYFNNLKNKYLGK